MPSVDVAKVVASDATVSDKIRALAGAGYARAEIARLLGKRYQHVRNVLEGDRVGGRRRAAPGARPPATRQAVEPGTSDAGGRVRLVIGPGGEIVLPATLLAVMKVGPGDVLIGKLSGDDLSLTSGAAALKRVQAMIRGKVPAGVSLVDELLDDRRRAAEADERAECVVDSSVILAMLNQEPGGESVAPLLPGALMSAVNLAEVASKLVEWGLSREELSEALETVTCDIAQLDSAAAVDVGWLHGATRGKNISLGDRCCLALGLQSGLPVLTADRAWASLGLDLEIRLLR